MFARVPRPQDTGGLRLTDGNQSSAAGNGALVLAHLAAGIPETISTPPSWGRADWHRAEPSTSPTVCNFICWNTLRKVPTNRDLGVPAAVDLGGLLSSALQLSRTHIYEGNYSNTCRRSLYAPQSPLQRRLCCLVAWLHVGGERRFLHADICRPGVTGRVCSPPVPVTFADHC